MSRPRKDEIRVPVRRRIAQAFWDALGEMPYGDVRVMDLAKRAGINHNMIYYYYNSIPEMAVDALRTELADRRLQDALYDLFTGAQTADAAEVFAPSRRSAKDDTKTSLPRKRQIAQLYAAAGADTLKQALTGEIRRGWLDRIGLEDSQLSAAEQMQLSFLLGGLCELLAAPETMKTPSLLADAAKGAPGDAFRGVLSALASRPDCVPKEAPSVPAESETPAAAKKPAVKAAAKKPAAKAPAAKKPASKAAEEKPKTAKKSTAEEKPKTAAKKPAADAAAKKKAAEAAAKKRAEEKKRLEAERLEAERLEAERLEAERLEAEREDSREMEVWML